MKDKIVLYCKSHLPDLDRVKILVDSVNRHNLDKIKLYISVPSTELQYFGNALGHSVILIPDEEICTQSLENGWKHQQLVKSSFWKLGLCENYCVLDSDCYFIRPFTVNDFIVEGTDIPYTVMHEQKDLFSWTANKSDVLGFDPIDSFKDVRKKIMDIFDRRGRYYDFGPIPVIWSRKVWKELQARYLAQNNLTLAQLFDGIPSEFSWYGEWLMASNTIPIYPVEPLFKVFHYPHQYIDFKSTGYTESQLAKNYMGIVMQSNWGAPLKF
jgi:hypothetical protein